MRIYIYIHMHLHISILYTYAFTYIFTHVHTGLQIYTHIYIHGTYVYKYTSHTEHKCVITVISIESGIGELSSNFRLVCCIHVHINDFWKGIKICLFSHLLWVKLNNRLDWVPSVRGVL